MAREKENRRGSRAKTPAEICTERRSIYACDANESRSREPLELYFSFFSYNMV
jgi:hypothetical protein